VSLNKKHYDQALAIRGQIKEMGNDEPAMKVHAVDIYKKSFTFPQIAHNDYAVEQFEVLSITEQNLNKDPTNEQSFSAFTKSADEIAQNLKERYHDQWVDPKDDRASPAASTD
jgi:hypothetical protein